MKIKSMLLTLFLCMNFGIICYGEETGDTGVWNYVSASIPYELEGMQEPPETAVLTLIDERTDLEYEREVSLKRVTEIEQVWSDHFSLPITISGYDSDIFLLGEMEISANEDLTDYGTELLRAAGLSPDYYRIESVEWVGEPYETDGVLFRDAMAKGEKLIRTVEVLYGGQVRMPEIVQTMEEEWVAETEVEESKSRERIVQIPVEETESVLESGSVPDLEYETLPKATFFEKASQWVQEHWLVMTISVGALVLLVGVFLLAGYEIKKKNRD